MLWGFAVAAALLPPTLILGSDFSADPIHDLLAANDHGLFRDLMFAMIPASILAISSCIGFLSSHITRLSPTSGALSILFLITNILTFAGGIIAFLLTPIGIIFSNGYFIAYAGLFYFGLAFSLFAEVTIACLHWQVHREQKNDSRPARRG